jgi:hypothetical protein
MCAANMPDPLRSTVQALREVKRPDWDTWEKMKNIRVCFMALSTLLTPKRQRFARLCVCFIVSRQAESISRRMPAAPVPKMPLPRDIRDNQRPSTFQRQYIYPSSAPPTAPLVPLPRAPVSRFQRKPMGPIKLDSRIPPGAYSELMDRWLCVGRHKVHIST